MLRNFPHQVNRIPKIRGALGVASDLIIAGKDISDDATFGYEVARAGIYNFRGLDSPTPAQLEAVIRADQTKPPANQGPRTFSRDLRRTLQLLRFLERSSAGWAITPLGRDVLGLPDPPDAAAASLWIQAVLQLELADVGLIHPALDMLRMVAQEPGVEKKWLAFALELKDDSDAELLRVQHLKSLGFEKAVSSIGATSYGAANAVKILPSLLEQLGLLSINDAVCNLTTLGLTTIAAPGAAMPVAPTAVVPPVTTRRARGGYKIGGVADVHDLAAVPGRPRTTEEQLHTAALLEERTSQHQVLVRRIVARVKNVSEVRCSDDAFDILTDSTLRPEVLLIEAKTLRGDALVQARIALGQLLYYEHFDVRPTTDYAVLRIAAFDSEPGEQTRRFLAACGVESIVATDSAMIVPETLRDYFA